MVSIRQISCATRQKLGNMWSQTGNFVAKQSWATKLLNFVACLTSALAECELTEKWKEHRVGSGVWREVKFLWISKYKCRVLCIFIVKNNLWLEAGTDRLNRPPWDVKCTRGMGATTFWRMTGSLPFLPPPLFPFPFSSFLLFRFLPFPLPTPVLSTPLLFPSFLPPLTLFSFSKATRG